MDSRGLEVVVVVRHFSCFKGLFSGLSTSMTGYCFLLSEFQGFQGLGVRVEGLGFRICGLFRCLGPFLFRCLGPPLVRV